MVRHRPNLNPALRALLKDISASMPEFSHVRPSRILVVAGEARRASRATVKPLAFEGGKRVEPRHGHRKALVTYHGRRILYCITLRPLFFRSSTAEERIETLLHELYHVSPAFDGTLDKARRHARLGKQFQRTLRPLVRRYLKRCPPEVLAPFSYDGEVRVWQWLERPSAFYVPGQGAKIRTRYNEEQLFLATVRMVTRRTRAARPPKAKIDLH